MKSAILLVISVLFIVNATTGEEKKEAEPAYEPAKFFRTLILPILDKRCYECHSEREAWDDGGLVLDTKAGILKGGDHGPAVVPFNTKKSSLLRTVNADESGNMMPPDERLPPEEIALLTTWILLGAPDPRSDSEDERNSVQTKDSEALEKTAN